MTNLAYTPLTFNLISKDIWIGKNVRIGHGVVIEHGCQIGNNCIIGHHTILRSNTVIGDNTVIAHLCVCEGDTMIGSNVTIQSQTHLTKHTKIADHVFVAHGVFTSNTVNIKHGRDIDLELKGPIIEYGARIGCHCTLYPGVTIGENSLVGMHSLVTKDVPAKQVWYGSPAKFVRNVRPKELL